MPNAQVLIGQITLTSTQTTVVFNNLPQNYGDLRLVASLRTTAASGGGFTLNGDSTSGNYSWVQMFGNGSTTVSNTGALANSLMQISPNTNFPSSSPMSFRLDLMEYTSTDKHKTMIWRSDDSAAISLAIAGRWASLSAVTSISLTAFNTTWAAGSTFALYGVLV